MAASGFLTVTDAQLTGWLAGLLWPFMRIGATLTAMPFLGAILIPVRVRLGLSLLLAWFVAPLIPPMPEVPLLSLASMLISAQQVLIGLAMGFILQLVFSAFSIAGENIAMTMGLGFAQLTDPQSGTQAPVVGQYYAILVMLLFLALNGHLVLIELLVKSFSGLPVGLHGLSGDSFWRLVGWAAHMYVAAVLVALPALAALLLVNLSFGVITRAAPQLNIFAVGFPMTILVGFVIVLATVPTVEPHVRELLLAAFRLVARMTGG